MFLKCFYEAPSGVLVNHGILIKFLAFYSVDKAYGRNKLYIALNSLVKIRHLPIQLWDIFGICEFNRHNALLTQEAV